MGGIKMRKILAVTMAFMLAAIVLSPALGYTAQSASKPAFTAQSGAMVKYSLTAGASAQSLAQVAEKTVREASVQSTRPAYSVKMGGLVPYSVKMEGAEAVKKPEVVEIPKVVETPAVEVNETNVTPTVPEVNITPVEPKFVLSGMVFDDLNSSGTLDQDEMGLANWTVDLENPEGSVIASTMTALDGTYVFADLSAGDYVVALVLPVGWELVSPLQGNRSVTITDADVAGVDFAAKVKVIAAPEVIPTPTVPEMPANATEV
jgi:hypothetical protein